MLMLCFFDVLWIKDNIMVNMKHIIGITFPQHDNNMTHITFSFFSNGRSFDMKKNVV